MANSGYNTNVEITLIYKVKKVKRRFSNGAYLLSVQTISQEGAKKTTFPSELDLIGFFKVVKKSDQFKSTNVHFAQSQRFGLHFVVYGDTKTLLPETSSAIASWLQAHVTGLGKTSATKIAVALGASTIRLIAENPEVLEQKELNLPLKKRNAIIEVCQNNLAYEDVVLMLREHDIPTYIAEALYDKYGKLAPSRLRENPYSLYDPDVLPFRYAEKCALHFGMSWNMHDRLMAAVRAAMDERFNRFGDTCVEKNNLEKLVEYYLARSSFYLEDDMMSINQDGYVFSHQEHQQAIKELLDAGELVAYEYNKDIYYYRKVTYHAETDAAQRVIAISRRKPIVTASKTQIERFLRSISDSIVEEQIEGVINAVGHGFAILTGGPGTGKTFTVKAVVDTIHHFNPDARIVQAAPTAKAAAKMRESSGMDADTIHALFKIGVGDQPTGAQEEYILDADYLIVDESSMIGIELFDQMLSHVAGNTKILLVGDPVQLPSISCGLVLRSLIESKTVPVAELSQIHRQAMTSTIVRNAHKIRNYNDDGNQEQDFNLETYKWGADDHAHTDFIFYTKSTDADIAEEIVHLMDEINHRKQIPLSDIMVLTPLHSTLCGTVYLNQRLQELLNPHADADLHYVKNVSVSFYIDDRVINTSNFKLTKKDKETGEKHVTKVKNGDIGTVIDIQPDKSVTVKFDSIAKPIVFSTSRIQQLDLAYAMTVHKSQGSEAKYVLMPFSTSRQHVYMLNKPLIYTAITRAKDHFIGIGNWDILCKGCTKAEPYKRTTLFAEFLKEALAN